MGGQPPYTNACYPQNLLQLYFEEMIDHLQSKQEVVNRPKDLLGVIEQLQNMLLRVVRRSVQIFGFTTASPPSVFCVSISLLGAIL
jgi:hypothetical protein